MVALSETSSVQRNLKLDARDSPVAARHPRFHLHFTPTGASWINLVERWFAALTEKQLRRGVHRSTRELELAIHRYAELTNAHPKPFIWTKTADEILASVARFCQRISNSGHKGALP
jgi:transposase